VSIIQISRIQVRRGQENTTGIPQLAPGEFAWAEDTEHLYIGKRVSEGANTDENSRILTDKDLTNVFGLLVNASGANTATVYKYKFEDPAVNPYSQVRSVQHKLDDFVSVLDFVPGGLVDNLDSPRLQTAINTIFSTVTNERKILRLPAGVFNIVGTVSLPPYTTLVGEGPDATTIVFKEDPGFPSAMFKTLDSKNIHIEGMTLRYEHDLNFISAPLLSLDNTKSVNIKNVVFGNLSAATTVSTGTAIQLRGNSPSDISLASTGDILIDRCKFVGVGTGIHQSTGATNRFTIQNSEFGWLGNRGVEMWGAVPGGYLGPQYGIISNNTFNHIDHEAIYIGTPTTVSASYMVTSDNVFGLDVSQASTGTAIIAFNDEGNVSSNDRFEIYDHNISNTPSYYNPLVSGNAKVEIGYTHSTVIEPNTTYKPVLRIPLTDTQQMATISYKLNNNNMSRAGTLTMNTSPNTDGTWYSSVSDYYNYSEVDTNSSLNLTFSTEFAYSTSSNYVSLTCLNQQDTSSAVGATTTVFEYQLTLLV